MRIRLFFTSPESLSLRQQQIKGKKTLGSQVAVILNLLLASLVAGTISMVQATEP